MMGEAVFSLKVCTSKTMSSLLFLEEGECRLRHRFRLHRLRQVRAGVPDGADARVHRCRRAREGLCRRKRFGAAQCIACGCCSYVCPAERYLTQSVRLGRKIVKERKL